MPTATPLLTKALDYLKAEWPHLFPGERPPRTLSFVLQGTGVGKLIVYVLAAGQRRPRCLIKLPRSKRDNAELAHEYALVLELRARGGAAAQATLPEPLAAVEIEGWQIVFEHLLPGQLLSGEVPVGERFTLGRARVHLRQIGAWYAELQRAVWPQPQSLTEADIETLFTTPIRQAQRDAELRPHELRYLDELGQAAQNQAGQAWRLGFVHGDLRPGNVLAHPQGLRVIDWQFGQLRGLPMLDWFEFVFRYFADADGLAEITGDHDHYRAAFADVFLGAHAYSELAQSETLRLAAALDIPEPHLSLLMSMWLVDNTNKYMRFLGERAERGYLYLMQSPPGGPLRSFRQQLRRQVYPCLLGQLAQSSRAAALAHSSAESLRQIRYSIG